MLSHSKRKKLIPLVITILLFGIIYFAGRNIPQEHIRNLINEAGPMAPIVFILLSLLTYIIAPLSGTPVLFVGYYAFGQNVVFYAAIAAFIASITNFWIARRFGRSFVEKMVGKNQMHRVDAFTQNYGLFALFISRIFLKGLHDVVSYTAGLTSVPFLRYLIVSTAGGIPGVMIWYFLSTLVDDPTSFTLLTIAEVFFLFCIFAIGSFIVRVHKKE